MKQYLQTGHFVDSLLCSCSLNFFQIFEITVYTRTLYLVKLNSWSLCLVCTSWFVFMCYFYSFCSHV